MPFYTVTLVKSLKDDVVYNPNKYIAITDLFVNIDRRMTLIACVLTISCMFTVSCNVMLMVWASI